MKLLTQELLQRFAHVGRQEHLADPIVIAKFFNPCGSGTWYATEYDPMSRTFFGYVTGLGNDELGYFSLDELESYTGPLGLGIERDLYFKECPLSTLLPQHVAV